MSDNVFPLSASIVNVEPSGIDNVCPDVFTTSVTPPDVKMLTALALVTVTTLLLEFRAVKKYGVCELRLIE